MYMIGGPDGPDYSPASPQEMMEKLAEGVLSDNPIVSEQSRSLLADMVLYAAGAMALAITPEHDEECPESHQPHDFLEYFSQVAAEADASGWQEVYDDFWERRRVAEGMAGFDEGLNKLLGGGEAS